MTSKHWALVGGAVACLIPFTVSAAPWIGPGDLRERHTIQAQADSGQLNRTVTTWPIQKASIGQEPSQEASRHLSLEGASERPFLRSFSGEPLEHGELGLEVEYQGDWWAVGLSPSVAVDPADDDSFRLDGSYVAMNAFNWQFGAGAVDRWWGPGWQSSLILSNNARPAPGIWLNRVDEKPFETPLLSWIGPWQLTFAASQLEEEREVSEPLWVGIRGTFRPVPGLDIGLTRTFLLGGEGRSSSLGTFWDAFTGNDNPRDSSEDPSNQLGAVDIRYGFGIGEETAGIYTQMMGEDEAGGFPARKSWLFGADATTSLWGRKQRWFIEATDTLADNLFGDPMPDISYEHRVYRTGYRYKGRNMAASIDSDSQAFTVGYYDFFGSGSTLGASVTLLDLMANPESRVTVPDPDVEYTVPARDQSVLVVSGHYEMPVRIGKLSLYAQLAEDKIEVRSGELDQWSVSARWSHSF
tara:strand:+ start:941 stop:2344 length:1404 start_codon:yes stop_codon:yes gene_type:complete